VIDRVISDYISGLPRDPYALPDREASKEFTFQSMYSIDYALFEGGLKGNDTSCCFQGVAIDLAPYISLKLGDPAFPVLPIKDLAA